MRHLALASKVLGIRPWEWSRLTVEEADGVCDALDAYEQEMQEMAQSARG